jgi:DHA1 family bicyclomycin/chloramphenicol resistance-like MFS transporter
VSQPAPAVAPHAVDDASGRGGYVRFVLVLGALIALGPLTIDMYLPAFPRISDEYAASDSQVQLTLTGMLLGLAVGQLVIGPLSDMFGRRRPLMVGLTAHGLASLACAVAPSVEVLAGLRLLQGFSGAAVSVTAMAMVRDRFEGVAMARLMARLMLVIGLAPIIAPSLGGLVLELAGWRTIFHVLALAAVSLLVLASVALTESLPPERRRPARLRSSLSSYAALVRDRRFLALGVVGGAMMSTLFSYVAGASFVLQDGFGVSERSFALLFGLNAAAFVVGSQVNPLLLRRFRLLDVLTGGVLLTVAAALALTGLALGGVGGIVGVMVPLSVVLFSAGITMPNTPALALQEHGREAGSAAAVLGFLQFGIGAGLAPVVGAFGTTSAVPMGGVMVAASLVATTLLFLVVRRR